MSIVNDLAWKVLLVTGVTGFIGCHVVRRLENDLGASFVLLLRQIPCDVDKGRTLVTAAEDTLRAAVSRNQDLGPINIVRVTSHLIRHIVEMLENLTGFRGPIQFRIDRPGAPRCRLTTAGCVRPWG